MRTHQGREHRGKVCSLEASPGLLQDPPALALVAYAVHGRVEGDLPEERPAKPRQEAAVVRNLSHPRGLLLRSPLPYSFRYWLTAADLDVCATASP